jgi:dTDP-4-dehydrorhamnose 3,5-epimerase
MTSSVIPGVRYLRHVPHEDSRGAFREIWRASAFPDAEAGTFVQANLSSSAAGVLRGLHFHLRQLDYWTVQAGVVFLAVVDIRPRLSGDAAPPVIETRTLERDDAVVIPSGVAHGFLALEPAELLYLVTNEYDGTDELGFAWNDPAVAVAWPAVATPDGRPVLSERDSASPALEEAIARLRA